MDTPTRLANIGLAALAIVAAGTTGYAIWSVRQPPPVTAAVSQSAGTAAATDAPATTQDGAGADDAKDTEGPDDAATTSTATDAGDPAAISDWVDAWSEDDADLLVIGDGYSNLPDQWVQLWAARVGQDRPVTIHHWGEAEDVDFNDPIVLSEGEGPTLGVWSASRAGTTVGEAAERYPAFDDAAPTPEAILVTLGRSSADEDIPAALDELFAQFPGAPVLLTIGPSGLYDAAVSDALAAWAFDHADQVSLVDLRQSAAESPSAEEWAAAFGAALDQG